MNSVKIVTQVYTGINNNDIDLALRDFDSQIERVEPEGFPDSGTYIGIENVRAHFLQARSKWAEGGCYPERFQIAGNQVIAFIYVKVRLKDSPDWIEGDVTDVFTINNGKIIMMRTFGDSKAALDWVGV